MTSQGYCLDGRGASLSSPVVIIYDAVDYQPIITYVINNQAAVKEAVVARSGQVLLAEPNGFTRIALSPIAEGKKGLYYYPQSASKPPVLFALLTLSEYSLQLLR